MDEGVVTPKAIARRNIKNSENGGCVWKLFSDDDSTHKQSLKYEILFKEALSENVNLYIYDLNMNMPVVDGRAQQIKSKTKPF
jgi:hypothetical protein